MIFTHRFVQHRARAIVALLALAVVAVALAACGGSGSGGSGDAQTLLRQTFTGTHQIRSGKANVQLRIVATGDPSLQGPIEATIAGPFESAGSGRLPKFDLAIDANAEGQGIKAGVTSTSDQLFVNFGGTSYAVPAQVVQRLQQSFARSQQQGSTQPRTSLKALGIDPLGWLQDATVVGTESVGGAQTDHISAKVNVGALLDDVDVLLAKVSAGGIPGVPASDRVPSRLPASARSEIEQAVKSATFDVWSGKTDHTLRKLTLALDVAPPRGKVRSVTVNLSVELTDLNQPQTITAPASSRPLNELLGQFSGLLGGALGGSAGGSGSSGGASSAQLNAYAQCVQRAGSNVTEAQKCASLLTR